MDNGSIMCWGRNHYGQLGRGYSNSSGAQSTPMYTMPLPTGRHAVAIDIGHYHVCAVLDNGSIACWGPGNSHRLGTGSTSNEDTPTVIQFFDSSNPAVDVALGRHSGCGLFVGNTTAFIISTQFTPNYIFLLIYSLFFILIFLVLFHNLI